VNQSGLRFQTGLRSIISNVGFDLHISRVIEFLRSYDQVGVILVQVHVPSTRRVDILVVYKLKATYKKHPPLDLSEKEICHIELESSVEKQ
jgi:hypothetical protein